MTYHKGLLNTETQKFTFSLNSKDEVLKVLKDCDPEKSAGIYSLSWMFLKEGAVVLALPTSKLCNILIKRTFTLKNYLKQTVTKKWVKNRSIKLFQNRRKGKFIPNFSLSIILICPEKNDNEATFYFWNVL